jgi:hypothetical protein
MKRLLLALILAFAATCGLGAWYSSHEAAALQTERWQLRRAEIAADHLLDRPIPFYGNQIALDRFRELIAVETGLEVVIDEAPIAQYQAMALPASRHITSGLRPPPPRDISARLPIGMLSLRSGLAHTLGPLDLDYDLHGSALFITTAEGARSRLETVVYPFPQPAVAAADEHDWAALIQATIEPWDWHEVGGRGHVQAVPGAIVVVHRPPVQRQVRQLLDLFASLEQRPESLQPRGLPPIADSAERRRILAALDQAAEIHALEKRLDGIIANLAAQHGVPMAIDARHLEEAGVPADTPITKDLSGVSLRSLLRHVLNDLELTYVIRDEAILITTPEESESILTTLVYPVHDLVAWPGAVDFDSLVELIAITVAPHSWDEVGGPGNISAFGDDCLVVGQTLEVHESLQELLARLRVGIADGGDPVVPSPWRNDPQTDKIFAALDRPIAVRFQGAPLGDVCSQLSGRLGFKVVLDVRKLDEAGVNTNATITCDFPAAPLRSQLQWILDELELTWAVRDEVLLITTPEEAESQLLTEVFDVRSLIDPDLGTLDEDELIELVTSAISPQSWDEVGGPGSQTIFRGLLVISQTDDVLLEVEGLLTALLRHCRPYAARDPSRQAVLVEPSPTAEHIERMLAQPIDVDYCGWRLDDLLHDLAGREGVPLVVGRRYSWNREVDFGAYVSISLRDRTLGGVLDEILAPLGLGYVVHQHVLLVTSAEHAGSYIELRLYLVDDLARRGDRVAIRVLADQMQAALDPRYWDERGGPGMLHVLSTGWLLVSADWQKQQELADWISETSNMTSDPEPSVRGRTSPSTAQTRSLSHR